MRKILVVIDMQNDFIDGALGTKEACAIVENVKNKISSYPKTDVYATRDTHEKNYLQTQEGKFLPVEHCIRKSSGWNLQKEIENLLENSCIVDKPTFGSIRLAEILSQENEKENLAIEIVGLCTDICVVSNALILKAFMPEVPITVDSACCAGVTVEKHEAALETMRSCQINVV